MQMVSYLGSYAPFIRLDLLTDWTCVGTSFM